jgi:23S rRNA pseudouridine2605 synthase
MSLPPTPLVSTMPVERLQKILSRAGIASRRTAETLIQTGRVQVNGETVTRLGTTADLRHDAVLVDGRPLIFPEFLYFVVHKPIGFVSTLKDPEGRPTIRELLRDVRERVYPVGRLDFNSSGLLLLTNDGELTERLLHPRYQIPRTYHAKLGGTPTHQALQALRSGVRLDDGVITSPATVRTLRSNEQKTWLEITLREGRNREVRRMCESVGYHVEKLIRVSFGPLSLGDLPVGAYRSLSPKEIRGLKQIAGKIKNPS